MAFDKIDEDDDVLRVVFKRVDEEVGIKEVFMRDDPHGGLALLNKVVDDDGFADVFINVDDGKILDCMLVVVSDKKGFIVLTVDKDKRLESCNKELLLRGVAFVDKSEFLVDNNEDTVEGFFESVIFL